MSKFNVVDGLAVSGIRVLKVPVKRTIISYFEIHDN
jgi:hypothetical protein